MSYLMADPDRLMAAAGELAGIGSALSEANTAAEAPTAGVLAAGADEVSSAVAALFSSHAQTFQALSADAAAFHQQFVQLLTSAGGSYAGADASGAALLQTAQQGFQTVQQDVLGVVNAPTEFLVGRPLIGNGTNGTASNPNGSWRQRWRCRADRRRRRRRGGLFEWGRWQRWSRRVGVRHRGRRRSRR
jgi:hypothetical protein